MKNLEELFQSELKNLYALEKQSQETLAEIVNVRNEKLQKRLQKLTEANSSDFDKIKSILQKNSINPGSTTDSIANEILINLEQARKSDIDTSVKEAGLMASLLRLTNYKTTNYRTVRRMAKILKDKKTTKRLEKIMKYSQNQNSKLRKLSKKSIFKQAVKL